MRPPCWVGGSTAFPAVYLLADAPTEAWRFKSTVETIADRRSRRAAARAERRERWLDPLVLGYGNKKLWVLGAFDATAIEEYIQAEFVSK